MLQATTASAADARPGAFTQLIAVLEQMARSRLAPEAQQQRRVAEEIGRTRLVRLSAEAGLREPETFADEVDLLLAGGRVMARSAGAEKVVARLANMVRTMIALHAGPAPKAG